MTAGKKVVAVFGATGNQGASVCRSLLTNQSGDFEVRAITRNPDSANAKGLAALGARLVKADGFNKSEIEKAFTGAWAAFINTNSNDPTLQTPHGPSDYDFGVLVVDAAAAAGVKHIVYSTGPSTCMQTKGRCHIDGFETKFHVSQHGLGLGFESFVGIVGGMFMDNMADPSFSEPLGGFPTATTKGVYVCRVPYWGGDNIVPWLDVEKDLGDLVHGILLNPTQYHGKNVQATSDLLTFEDLVPLVQKLTGRNCRYEPLASWSDIPHNGSKCREELRAMFAFGQLTGGKYFGDEPSEIDTPRALKMAAQKAMGQEATGLTPIGNWIQRNLQA